MKNKKAIEKISGRIKTRTITCSINEVLIDPLIDIFGGGTEILENFFIERIGLKDKWDLEDLITSKLYEQANLTKRDNVTKEVEKIMCDKIINFYENKDTKKMNKNEIEAIKLWVKRAKKLKGELNEK